MVLWFRQVRVGRGKANNQKPKKCKENKKQQTKQIRKEVVTDIIIFGKQGLYTKRI